MKSIIALATLIHFTTVAFSQITFSKPSAIKIEKSYYYDSLDNFLGYEPQKYINQKLYLPPKEKGTPFWNHYGGFYHKPNPNKYRELDGQQNKYYWVIDVVDKVDAVYKDEVRHQYLKLVEEQSLDTVFYTYDPEYYFDFPFYVVGWFVKQRNTCVGKKFIIKYPSEDDLFDFKTGEKINFVNGDTWTCIDFVMLSDVFYPSTIYQNAAGNQIKSNLNKGRVTVWHIDSIKHISNKHPEHWKAILESKIRIGMNEEMVRLAWGEPQEIRETSYLDQWIYDGQYLYFENGILKSFN